MNFNNKIHILLSTLSYMFRHLWHHSFEHTIKFSLKMAQSSPKYVGEFLIIKPTRCTNLLNLFLEWNSTCFGQFLCPSSGVFYYTHSNVLYHKILLTAVSKILWQITFPCVQWKIPDDGQRNCPKHVEFHFKTKFDKLVHLVGFIIRKVKLGIWGYRKILGRWSFTE